MKLSDMLDARNVRIPLIASSKEDVLRELVELLPSASSAPARDGILEAVRERESRMSTGIGQGVAIPHGKSELVSGMEVAFGLAGEPIEFDSLDGEPSRIFFLLVSPPGMADQHVKTLARVSRLLTSDAVRDELAGAVDPEAVLAVLRREESFPEE